LRNTDGKPLFHKAIIESGGATARACYTPSNSLHEQQFREFLGILGAQDVPENKIIQTLRSFTTGQIKHASEAIYMKYNPSVRWPWQPVIDGEGGIVPVRPIDSWRAGKWHKIPILTGFNTNEGAMFTPKKLATPKQFTEFFHTLLPGLSNDDLKTLEKLYPDPLTDPSSKYLDTRIVPGLGPEFKRAEQGYAHFAYVAPVRHTAHFAATAGDKPVYLYHFAVNSSVVGGADHGSHDGYPTYVDDTRRRSDTLEKVAGLMHAYWTSFITTGDPNAVNGRFKNRPKWPVYTPEGGKLIVFGENNDEIAGGVHAGTAVKIDDDTWAVGESKYWWDRTEKFEL
jgi:carboxylesterase type B